MAATALTVFSCLTQESGQFAPPSVVSVSSENEGREAVVLHCELSDSRVEACGVMYGIGKLDHREECAQPGKSFEVKLSDVSQGVVYTWCAYYCAGGSELRSREGTFRLTSDADPIPIEDPAFKSWLVDHFDANRDGAISYSEAESVREITIVPSNAYNLQSLQGIEYMPNLESLDCSGEWYYTGDKSSGIDRPYYYVGPYSNRLGNIWGPIGTLRNVDVSKNIKLRKLRINNNSALGVTMDSFDVSNNLSLEELDLSFTWLSYPDVSVNKELRCLYLSHLRGVLADLSCLERLKVLSIDYPQDINSPDLRPDLDLSMMKELQELSANYNIHNLLALPPSDKLRLLRIDDAILATPLDLSDKPLLEVLECDNTGLQSLDLSGNPVLCDLRCRANRITELDVSHNPILVHLDCSDNELHTLDVSHNIHLGNGPSSGLWCVQRTDGIGVNYLETLYVAEGQLIPYVTADRDASHIPAETEIVELAPYSLGDIVESDAPGIVVAVSDEGRESLLMSVDEIHDWPWQESWDWCEGHGSGWRMPTINELKAIQPNFYFLNEKLRAAGYTPLTEENKCYWSCTPYEIAGYYYRERLWDGSIWYFGSDEWHECHANYTRAVKTISF